MDFQIPDNPPDNASRFRDDGVWWELQVPDNRCAISGMTGLGFLEVVQFPGAKIEDNGEGDR